MSILKNAAEARQITNANKKIRLENEMYLTVDAILDLILKEAESGFCEVTYVFDNEEIMLGSINRLTELGFSVLIDSETQIQITW